jgi:hypothetical protein
MVDTGTAYPIDVDAGAAYPGAAYPIVDTGA